jgi:virginiamycin B lyase
MRFEEIDQPGSGPYGVVAGSDGALWVTLVHSGQIAHSRSGSRLTRDGKVTVFDVGSGPVGITCGSDGSVWHSKSASWLYSSRDAQPG